jgi:hypothetical protein
MKMAYLRDFVFPSASGAPMNGWRDDYAIELAVTMLFFYASSHHPRV